MECAGCGTWGPGCRASVSAREGVTMKDSRQWRGYVRGWSADDRDGGVTLSVWNGTGDPELLVTAACDGEPGALRPGVPVVVTVAVDDGASALTTRTSDVLAGERMPASGPVGSSPVAQVEADDPGVSIMKAWPIYGVSRSGLIPRVWVLWRQAAFGEPYEVLSEYLSREAARDALRARPKDRDARSPARREA